MVVLSESMEPTFSRGDIILLANWQEVEVGDIPVIWFQGQPLPMVHRAVEILFDPVSQRQIFLRIFTVFSWIWSNFLILESYHAILSTTFVLLGIDNPADWPPLFGSITDAWTVQRFWGRFWHRIAAPTLTTWTHTILRIKDESQTTFEKAAVAFGVFFLSGIMHMTAAWRTDEGYVHLDVMFFCANFFAIAVEIVVSRAWMQVVRRAKLKPGAEARVCLAKIEYEWDEGEPTEERAVKPAIEHDSPGDRTPTPARSGPIVRSEITYTDNEGNVIKIVHRYPPDDVVKDDVPVDGDDRAIVPVKARNTGIGDDFVDSFWGEVTEVRRDSGRPVKE
ncbi:hypothetical protein KNSL1_009289 [Colletotrichum chrysophilum]|nr:hypothetical protein KNSL1_009289 [Colletotrichum chrysophilum]